MKRKREKKREMKKIKLVSSFTEDLIERENSVQRRYGGPALYGGYTLHVLGKSYSIITRPSKEILETLSKERFSFLIERVSFKDLCDTHFVFRHVYRGSFRTSYLLSKGCDIDLLFEDQSNDLIYIISPVYREISLEKLKNIISRGYYVAIDIQGFTRYTQENNLLRNYIDVEILNHFRGVKILHGGIDEVASIDRDPLTVIKIISKIVDPFISIISLGREGSIVYIRGKGIYRIYSYKGGVDGDETGCGDILLTSIVALLESFDPLDAVLKASLISGWRVERGFPFDIDRDILDKYYTRYIKYKLIST
jgi:hypothetical protein